jgi:hypothetical protein
VRLGQIPVTQPVVNVGEPVLDRGLAGPVALGGDGRGGLELGQRFPVPAEHDQHLAQGDPSGQLRIAERQGLGQVRVRLGVRVQLASHLGSPPPPLRCLGVPVGQLQVVGHRRGPGGGRVALVPVGQHVSRPPVESLTAVTMSYRLLSRRMVRRKQCREPGE